MTKILQKESPVLREMAKSVPVEEIPQTKIGKILNDMKEALDAQDDGVAIAAPQIGVALRIFVVSEKALLDPESPEQKASKNRKKLVFINPQIIKCSKKKIWMEEGCLSVRPLYGKTHRHMKATVRALDEDGKIFTYGGSGLLAQIFQHEIDHLNGILFIDHAKNVYELTHEENAQ